MPLLHGHVLQNGHELCDLHPLRAPFLARIATGTQPDEVAFEDFLPETIQGHPDDPVRTEPVVYCADRTTRSARAAGEACHDFLTTRLRRDVSFKVRIRLRQIDVSHRNSSQKSRHSFLVDLSQQVAGKHVMFRLLKNVQIKGARNWRPAPRARGVRVFCGQIQRSEAYMVVRCNDEG